MSEKSRQFKIEFSKQASSAVRWEAGFLIQSFHEGKPWVWLKNNKGVTIRKGCVSESFIAKLDTGDGLTCAGYMIRILYGNDIQQQQALPVDTEEPSRSEQQLNTQPISTSTLVKVKVPHVDSLTNVPAAADTFVPSQKAFLDPVLLRSMRSYQVEAASFLLNRLQDGPCSMHSSACSSSLNGGIPLTGAILADDMGTGKTLVGLSVIWALCRHAQGKVRQQHRQYLILLLCTALRCSALL
jgi:hypothetical protein